MAMIMNASSEVQHTTVHGNHFTLKPGQIKNFQDSVGKFLAMERRYLGFVGLPEEFEEPAFQMTPEGKALIEAKRVEGVNNRCQYLRQLIFNNQVSMKQDLDKADMKVDPRIFASVGEINAMEELAKYQAAKDDGDAEKIARIKALEAKIGKVSTA